MNHDLRSPIERAGSQSQGASLSQRVRHPRARRDLSSILTVAALFVGLLTLPLIYYLIVVDGRAQGLGNLDLWRHIYLNSFANTFVMVVAARSLGKFERQFGLLITSLITAHGAVAFLTLTLRIYYSNQIMMIAVVFSLFLATLLLYIQRQFHRPCAAVVGEWHPIVSGLRIAHDHLAAPIADLRAYDLVLTTSSEPPAGWTAALTQSMMAGKAVRHVAEYLEEEQGLVSPDHFTLDHLPLGGLTSYQIGKRFTDVALVLLVLPLALPLLMVGAFGIWATMGRPILFIQPRVGLGGGIFRIHKLRTMRLEQVRDAETATVKKDMRVTPLGAWLRRFRIDELPQLWNVLKGDMSVVGPRPEQPSLTEEYCRHLPAFECRSLVRPGITGWAQVRAGYAADLEETRVKLAYDLFYLKNYSFSLDMQILVRTLGTLLIGKGVR